MSTYPVQDKNSANAVAFFLYLVSLLLQQNHRCTKDSFAFVTLLVAAPKHLGKKKQREGKLYFGSGFADTVHCAEEVMVAGSLRQPVLLYLQPGHRERGMLALSPFSHFYAVQNPSPQHTAVST